MRIRKYKGHTSNGPWGTRLAKGGKNPLRRREAPARDASPDEGHKRIRTSPSDIFGLLYPPQEPTIDKPARHYLLHEAEIENFLRQLKDRSRDRELLQFLIGTELAVVGTLITAQFNSLLLPSDMWVGAFITAALFLLGSIAYVAIRMIRARGISGDARDLACELGKRGLQFSANGNSHEHVIPVERTLDVKDLAKLRHVPAVEAEQAPEDPR